MCRPKRVLHVVSKKTQHGALSKIKLKQYRKGLHVVTS